MDLTINKIKQFFFPSKEEKVETRDKYLQFNFQNGSWKTVNLPYTTSAQAAELDMKKQGINKTRLFVFYNQKQYNQLLEACIRDFKAM